ncbi:hypothetical protein [Nonomuraea aurantiaca]|uniref:hypothetical protein n=1 Tax=Nonomuraea aurantiaca TaxID=2878562 RepID=UPI001CD9B2B6|nr:hypothetical protein [Nonomuraea aurantiaca]MCA2227713.1 hypothetical protein [Nonomuraea aurantiaca]
MMLGSHVTGEVMAGLRDLDVVLPLDSRVGSPPGSPPNSPMSSRTGDWAGSRRGSGLRRRVDLFGG